MKEHTTMKHLPESERPYEKFVKYGARSLSDAELLAIVIRTGSQDDNSLDLMRKVLTLSRKNTGILSLHDLTLEDLQKIKGIGKIKSVQLKCIGELSRRMAKSSASRDLIFTSPETIAGYYMEDMRHNRQEVMMLLMLNTKNHFLGDKLISKGTVNASLISPREIFLEALSMEAVSVILIHNHPSGDPTPSKEDHNITKRIKESGLLLGIHLLDHIVIGDNKYISFHERGIL